ncbi:hypothetical protein MNBD_BACTEROID03-2832 [hydrothermal vent metagenome]|uniref:N-acetyltransferase domain-containing protein n=1 Tax=hydrothermal vent metagenome TaxID=652676 RepID=A0A3B0U9D8_9ZZZZ
MKNVPEILDNGYDKTPNPYTEKDAIEFINKEARKKPEERFLIYWNNEFAGEIGITIKKDVFRLNAEIGYFISKKFWGKGLATQAVKKMTGICHSKPELLPNEKIRLYEDWKWTFGDKSYGKSILEEI